jgi:hypothetical protein
MEKCTFEDGHAMKGGEQIIERIVYEIYKL